MVGESFHPSGCWGEDSNHTRLGATVQKLLRLFAFLPEQEGKIRAVDLAHIVAKAGVERIIYTDVARDGMLTGINIEHTLLLARESGLKVTASGGVSSLEDLKQLKHLAAFGVDSVIIGKALYEGRFTLREASQAAL